MKNQVRLLWLKLAATLAAMMCGCMSPTIGEELIEPDDSEHIVIDLQPIEPSALPSITVTASADAYSELAGWLGKSNTITIGESMKVERPDVTLNIPAGASVSYEAGETLATFKFAKPLPTVTASVLGFHVSPTLSQVILRPDGSGVASTGLGRHGFRWLADEDDAGSSVAADAPKSEMQFQSASWCGICRVAEKALDEADKKGELPFKVKKVELPSGVSPPRFRWQDNNGDWWHSDGWHGVKPLIEAWKKSLNGRVQRAGGPAVSRPFVQPDRVSSIGSRSVAIWSINGDSTPSRGILLSHLTNDGIHRGRHDRAMLESLTTEQLRWLHDRDHTP